MTRQEICEMVTELIKINVDDDTIKFLVRIAIEELPRYQYGLPPVL
jgi:hypothetical protein